MVEVLPCDKPQYVPGDLRSLPLPVCLSVGSSALKDEVGPWGSSRAL